MTVITARIPDSKKAVLSSYIEDIGGEVVSKKTDVDKEEDDDEVTHGVFFGENIKRVIKAFSKK